MCQNILHVISHVWLKSSQRHYDVAKEKVRNVKLTLRTLFSIKSSQRQLDVAKFLIIYMDTFLESKNIQTQPLRNNLRGRGALKPQNKKILARYTAPPPQYT